MFTKKFESEHNVTQDHVWEAETGASQDVTSTVINSFDSVVMDSL